MRFFFENKRLIDSKNLKNKETYKSHIQKQKNLTSAVDPFIKIRQAVQPISVTLLQTGLTFHSHKIGDGLFGLLVFVTVDWAYVCQPTNPIDVYPLTVLPASCIISASDIPQRKNSSCSLKINLFLFMLSAESSFKKSLDASCCCSMLNCEL